MGSREVPRGLGDLPAEYIKSVEKTLDYPPEQTVKVWNNGVDVHISVENVVKKSITIDKDEPLASTSESVSKSPSGGITQECDEKSGEHL